MTGSDPIDRPSLGAFVGRAHHYPLHVFFEDTDCGGVVYHANYLRFMERGRSAMLAVRGIAQEAAWAAGEGVYAVTAVAIRYRRPARLGDTLVVVSRLAVMRAASCVIQQTVMRGAEVCAEGEVTVAFLDANGRPRRQPASWLERFRPLLPATGEE